MSVLSAATNNLAQLINYLDLEAPPGTLDCSLVQPSPLSAEKLACSVDQADSLAWLNYVVELLLICSCVQSTHLLRRGQVQNCPIS